jgi:hypothetical protein
MEAAEIVEILAAPETKRRWLLKANGEIVVDTMMPHATPPN